MSDDRDERIRERVKYGRDNGHLVFCGDLSDIEELLTEVERLRALVEPLKALLHIVDEAADASAKQVIIDKINSVLRRP